ncbi:hypothetical protein [Nannocystis pusilla]|uniref:hypothetical protein n=1 Tax=Nannocystis pusilla TaxID=889268 RepID=UPI003DA65809
MLRAKRAGSVTRWAESVVTRKSMLSELLEVATQVTLGVGTTRTPGPPNSESPQRSSTLAEIGHVPEGQTAAAWSPGKTWTLHADGGGSTVVVDVVVGSSSVVVVVGVRVVVVVVSPGSVVPSVVVWVPPSVVASLVEVEGPHASDRTLALARSISRLRMRGRLSRTRSAAGQTIGKGDSPFVTVARGNGGSALHVPQAFRGFRTRCA